jgi:hypothetical protein
VSVLSASLCIIFLFRPLSLFTGLNHQRNTDIRGRLKVTGKAATKPTKVEKSFGNGRRACSVFSMLLLTEGVMRLGSTKMTMERPKPFWDL